MLSKEGLSKKFGERLKEEMGTMSQEKLALKSGLHKNYIGKLERGEACPSIYAVYKIALALKIKPLELFKF
jgi:transcriptional regulator with XRE-family HTH domain